MPSSVNLGAALEDIVDKLVANGRYNSRSEVIREGVRRVHEHEARVAALAAFLEPGIAAANAGQVVDGELVFAELKRRQA